MRGPNLLLPGLLAMAASTGVAAAEVGDRDQGRGIANRWCAECHDVTGTSPRLKEGPPSFPGIASRTDTTPAGLRAFLHTPHGQMPNLSLTRTEIDDLIAYVMSLKR